MAFFHTKKPGSRLSLVFEIGSGSVGAALVQLSREGKPKMLSALREPIPFQETISHARLPALMIGALDRAFLSLQKDSIPRLASAGHAVGKIPEAFVAFSAPWYLSETKQLRIEKIKPFAFSREIADAALEAEADEFEKKEQADEPETIPLDSEIIGAILDGYPVKNPFGKRAMRAELSAYLSFTSKAVLDSVRTSIMKPFSPKEILFSSFPLAEYRILEKKIASEDFVMASICREVTEISLVKKGVLQETASFPIGKNHLVRKLMKLSGSSQEIASSELETYFRGAAAKSHSSNAEKAIEEVGTKWKKSFRECIEAFSNAHYLPSACYLLAQPGLSAFFEGLIRNAGVSDLMISGGDLEIIPVSRDLLKAEFDPEGETDADAYLMIAALSGNMRFAGPELAL